MHEKEEAKARIKELEEENARLKKDMTTRCAELEDTILGYEAVPGNRWVAKDRREGE